MEFALRVSRAAVVSPFAIGCRNDAARSPKLTMCVKTKTKAIWMRNDSVVPRTARCARLDRRAQRAVLF